MLDSRDARLTALAAPLGLDVDAPLVIGGQYCAVLQYGELLFQLQIKSEIISPPYRWR